MLGRRLRRRPNIRPPLVRRPVFDENILQLASHRWFVPIAMYRFYRDYMYVYDNHDGF